MSEGASEGGSECVRERGREGERERVREEGVRDYKITNIIIDARPVYATAKHTVSPAALPAPPPLPPPLGRSFTNTAFSRAEASGRETVDWLLRSFSVKVELRLMPSRGLSVGAENVGSLPVRTGPSLSGGGEGGMAQQDSGISLRH